MPEPVKPPPDPAEIPEQRVPPSPELLADATTLPDLGQDLELYKWADWLNEYQRKDHSLKVARTLLWQRKVYAVLLFLMSTAWLTYIAIFLWEAGKGRLTVSDPVQIALITTTTINVLGLFYIVARWLFPNTPPPEPLPKK